MSAANSLPIACDLTVLGDNEKRRQKAVLNELRARVKAVEELPDGYAFGLVAKPYMLQLVAEFISFESRCCPFLAFALDVRDGGSSITLRLTGGEGVKDFLHTELGL